MADTGGEIYQLHLSVPLIPDRTFHGFVATILHRQDKAFIQTIGNTVFPKQIPLLSVPTPGGYVQFILPPVSIGTIWFETDGFRLPLIYLAFRPGGGGSAKVIYDIFGDGVKTPNWVDQPWNPPDTDGDAEDPEKAWNPWPQPKTFTVKYTDWIAGAPLLPPLFDIEVTFGYNLFNISVDVPERPNLYVLNFNGIKIDPPYLLDEIVVAPGEGWGYTTRKDGWWDLIPNKDKLPEWVFSITIWVAEDPEKIPELPKWGDVRLGKTGRIIVRTPDLPQTD